MAKKHEELVEDWRAMKAKLEDQLKTVDDDVHPTHGLFTKETLQRWIVELDDLIIKYSFEI
jgi:hypothetical protein